MAAVTCNSLTVSLADNETALEGLLRAGVDVPNSCRGGACQSCLVRAVEGTPPPASQAGLKDALKAQGFFLACICRPTADLSIALASDAVPRVPARVRSVERLTADVARLTLHCDAPFDYRPGQFANVVRSDGLSRPYSIASLHGDEPYIEMHVRKVPGGQMSGWIYDDAADGHELELRGPVGECFYTPGKPHQPLLLVGTGTGLAPLYAIARDALRQGHAGPIHLYHGAIDEAGLYMVREMQSLAANHQNLHYTACVKSPREPLAAPSADLRIGELEQIVLSDLGSARGWRCFLCGNPQFVASLRKKLFLAGTAMKEIHSDAFLMRPTA
ncbi:2Fe-2S iron-sulfur cluster-binding protein [Humisphaera borealis]|uniref:2Fe-2S iron-sulfur cluster binding domain-containing protein n=1 Tax=Humisphaera borealis TaxID=2807512 RepID=A0A7M2X472_9BACT|nr:2Fe-2S iron-sulfur cluster-binding protein [Humisphaera borealis]QOV92567.1 2Fe-2S iron-sulfur cluster binding domain-containing protein [Humisphaera borealis]